MEIGSKLQEARLHAGLTQEKAAEALGVSRQTISNWETGKTYPDIVSVIKMSDLYTISLDRLLKEKEEPPMSDYLDYLEESTNVVKSRNRLSKLLVILSYLFIWAIAIIVFWFFTGPTDGMGYSLMFLWVLLPVTTIVESAIIGRRDFWGRAKWCVPLIAGVMYMLAEYATFSASNMQAVQHFNAPEWGMIPAGAVLSLLGLALGCLLRRRKGQSA